MTMRIKPTLPYFTAIVAWLAVTTMCVSQELKETLQDTGVGDRWTYNDWDSAKAAAAKTKKPILALFR